MFYVGIDLMKDIVCGVLDRDSGLPHLTYATVRNPHLWRAFTTLYALMLNSDDRLEKQAGLCEALSEVVLQYAACRVPRGLVNAGLGPMQKAQEYLVENLSRNVALEELAALVHLSPYYFLRRFRAVFGMPPHAYRLQQRIHVARKMLADGVSITQVASDTGFTDQSHFTKRFKAFVGATPHQYQLVSR